MTNRKNMASVALSCLGAFTAAHASEVQVQAHTQQGCQYFSTNCSGTQRGLSIKTINPNGEWQLDITRFQENDQNAYFDKSVSFRDIASLRGVAQWDTQAEGLKAHLKKQFYMGNNAGISIGGYAGKISAAIHSDARVDAHLRAFELNIPAIHIPAVPALGITAQDMPATQFSSPEINRTLFQDKRHARGKSLYGGLTLDSGYSYAFTPRMTGILGQGGNIGFDGIWATLNAGIILSSSAQHNTRTPTGDICQGQFAFPKSGINLTANLCVRRDIKHPLYDLERDKASELSTRINNRISGIAARIYDKTGYQPSVPGYTADDVLSTLGINNPYRWQPRLHLGVAGRTGNIVYGADIKQPLGNSHNKQRTYSATLGYEF